MKEHRNEFPLSAMSEALGVSRSGFYAASQVDGGMRAIESKVLREEIARIHEESRGHYGSPRIKLALDKRGISCGLNRVARIMREEGIQGVRQSRKRVRTTNSNHEHRASPNLIKGLEITRPNQVWAADITYIDTDQGWVYLAAVIDLYSRKIVGWHMADTLEASLVMEALKQALATRDWKPGLIHHSDRGVQYASKAFRSLLGDHSIKQSMSAKGRCYDNAKMESFFGTLKAEEVECYSDWQSARIAIFDYIETYYNRTRIHTSLTGDSPEEFERGYETNGPIKSKPPALNEFSEASGAPLVEDDKKEPETKHSISGSHDHRSHPPEYPLEGCSPAEPSSVSSGEPKERQEIQT